MKIIYLNDEIPKELKNGSIAIGNFDGIHLGHREIIKKAKQKALEKNCKTSVLTFEPHPIALFNPEARSYRITNENDKANLLESLGVDFMAIAKFDTKLASMSADDFIEDILVKKLSAKYIFTGVDFIFGHSRTGNTQLLASKADIYGYEYEGIEDVNDSNKIRYSSSRIRELIRNGNIEKANEMLGSNYTISAKVVKGRQDGRKIGFPTANLKLGNHVVPKYGVYKALTSIEGEEKNTKLLSAVNIGIRPTFEEKEPNIEVHILDFDSDIYNKTIKVELLNYIREERKFNNIDELKIQIAKDLENIRNQ